MWEDRLDFAQQLDRLDPIRSCRDLFRFPADAGSNEQVIYLVGNSLGLQPKAVESEMQKQLQRWANLGVRGHFEGDPGWIRWVDRPNEIMAQLVGADKNDVAIMNTLSVNLHLLLATFYKPTKKRYKILIEQSAFPSDQYVVRSQAAWHGFDPDDAVIECPTDVGVFSLESFDQVLRKNGDEIALVLLGGVNYVSGQYLDLAEITSRAKSYGCVVGFDLAHAVGNVEVDLSAIDCDFAAWCTYKYLNGGPGSLGAIYVDPKHQERLPALRGWWGHDLATRFKMTGKFSPAAGAERFNLSTMPLFSLVPIGVSLEIFEEVGFHLLREKSRQLTSYLEYLLYHDGDERISIVTPRDVHSRGAQLSIQMEGADSSLRDQLRSSGAMVDWREPGLIRAAPVPLYNSFEEVWRFAQILKASL